MTRRKLRGKPSFHPLERITGNASSFLRISFTRASCSRFNASNHSSKCVFNPFNPTFRFLIKWVNLVVLLSVQIQRFAVENIYIRIASVIYVYTIRFTGNLKCEILRVIWKIAWNIFKIEYFLFDREKMECSWKRVNCNSFCTDITTKRINLQI